MDPRLVKTGNAVTGTATTAQAISNINVSAQAQYKTMQETFTEAQRRAQGLVHVDDPNTIVGALRKLHLKKNYLPTEPAEGYKCFRSNTPHLQLFDKLGNRVLFENHFIVTDNVDAILECEDAIKHTRNVAEYKGPWAEPVVETADETDPSDDAHQKQKIGPKLEAGSLVPTSALSALLASKK